LQLQQFQQNQPFSVGSHWSSVYLQGETHRSRVANDHKSFRVICFTLVPILITILILIFTGLTAAATAASAAAARAAVGGVAAAAFRLLKDGSLMCMLSAHGSKRCRTITFEIFLPVTVTVTVIIIIWCIVVIIQTSRTPLRLNLAAHHCQYFVLFFAGRERRWVVGVVGLRKLANMCLDFELSVHVRNSRQTLLYPFSSSITEESTDLLGSDVK
jgi:hypothetical protein